MTFDSAEQKDLITKIVQDARINCAVADLDATQGLFAKLREDIAKGEVVNGKKPDE